MKPITLKRLTAIIEGKKIYGSDHHLIRSVNFGRPKHLNSKQVYFYTRKIDWSKQLDAIRRIKPIGVVLPNQLSTQAIPRNITLIKVPDAFQAFWKIALWNYKQNPVKAIGITGSTGKTTTTEMVASILKQRYQLIKTENNLNTYSYLPQYLTRLESKHQLLLLEMGMKTLNNIKRQCKIVRPHWGTVTNIGEAHAGSLGGLDLIVKAKQELVDGIRDGGTLFINADDTKSQRLSLKNFKGKVFNFGIRKNAFIRASDIHYVSGGMRFKAFIGKKEFPVFLPTYGIHNVYNALAAIGLAWAVGSTIPEIQKGLRTFTSPKMRLQIIPGKQGQILINDAWNANPSSMIAGLDVLKQIAPDRLKVAVLGDMMELGAYTTPGHQLVGKHVAKMNLYQLVTIGTHGNIIAQSAIKHGMNPKRVFSFTNRDQALRHLLTLPKNVVIYFKASRKLHLEKIVKHLRR